MFLQQRIMQLNDDISDVCEFALGETTILLAMFIDRIDELKQYINTWTTANRAELHMRSVVLLMKLQALKMF